MRLNPVSESELASLKKLVNNLFGSKVFEKIQSRFRIYKSSNFKAFFLIEAGNKLLNELALIFESIYSIGCPFIELHRNTPIINLAAIQVISPLTSNKIQITDKAIQLLIYGRDIFNNSIIKFEKPLDKNHHVIITDSEGRAYGMGKLLYSCEEFKKLPGTTVVIKNILDVGFYLRCEKQALK